MKLKYIIPLLALSVMLGCSDMGDPLILLPELNVTPGTVDFSSVTLGTVQERSITIINSGDGELTGQLSLDQTDAAFSIDPSGDFQIEAGDTLDVGISFQPTTETGYAADLNITSNDEENAEVAVSLSGSGTAASVAALSLSVTSLDFGTLMVGESDRLQLTISSIGSDALLIDSIRTNRSELTHDGESIHSIMPGANESFNVDFQATVAGNFTGDLFIYSNAGTSPDQISVSAVVEAALSYVANIQPIFTNNCTGCHGSNGGLSLASWASLRDNNSNNGPVVVPFNGAASLIIRKLRGTAGSLMPAGGPALNESTINDIETWIDQGALDN